MNRLRILFPVVFLASALLSAQAIPGRYLVEFNDEPALAVAAPRLGGLRLAPQIEPQVAARRAAIQATHALAAQSIQALGGTVRARFDLVFNGMAVDMPEAAAARVRQQPNVLGVYPVMLYHAHLDHAVNVHQIRDAWQTITGGQLGAGAGIKIGIIDSSIDTTHPAFQSFTTAVPAGYPKLSSEAMRAFANNKVIVVRDYTGEGGEDLAGHGTGVAMAAAGGTVDLKAQGILPFSGVAPGAWLGNYHVISSNSTSDSTLFMQALQDAIDDGMNVVNYSAGGTQMSVSDESGPQARAISRALAAGVLVVISAGNDGPELGTVGVPGVSPDAITVGANLNERIYDVGVTVADLPGVAARPGSNSDRTDVVQANMADVATLDPAGLACAALPPGSLKNKVALILRGTCAFDDKANNAELAGAIGAVIYNNDASGGLITMSVPTATLATMFVTNASGLAIKDKLAGAPDSTATLDFAGTTSVPISSDEIAYFSAGGPTVGGLIKPDLLAVGSWVITASTSANGGFPYVMEFGTSFSAPITTGAVADLMAARPGLTAAQYRSLIVNSAPRLNWSSGDLVSPQFSGSGKLNLLRSLQNPAAAAPTSLNFQSSPGAFDLTRSLVVTNLSDATDTFTIAVTPVNKTGAVASVSSDSFSLSKGESKTITVSLKDDAPAPGPYEGYLEITGTKTAVSTRVPYWLGVRGSGPKYIAVLNAHVVDFSSQSPRSQVSVVLRVIDSTGLPVDVADLPAITTTAPAAGVVDISPSGSIPGTFTATVRVGRADANGQNIFTIKAGGAERQLIFYVQ